MSSTAIHCLAMYGPFRAEPNPLTWRARLALMCMAEGHESLAELSTATGLSIPEAIDALQELGAHQLVMFAYGYAWYRIGSRWLSRNGWNIDEIDEG